MQVVFDKHDCYEYDAAYKVRFTLANVVLRERLELTATVDTGFDGQIMVDSATYHKLKLELSENAESQFPTYRTFSGTVLFKSSLARAIIAGKDTLAEVITPVHGGGKLLLGRRTLKDFTTLLQKAERCCMGEAKLANG